MTKKAIDFAQFNELPIENQLNLIQADGVHVGKRTINKQVVILYQLYGFYVEVYFKEYRKHIDHIITSAESGIIQPYLDQIHIRDLDNTKDYPK